MKQDIGAESKQITTSIKGSLIASRFFTFVMLGLTITIITMHMLRPQQKFYVDPPSGGRSEVFPLDEPNVTPSSLRKWATQAATSAYTIDFFHYKDNIEALRDYFTITGFKDYQASLDDNNTLKRIVKESLIVSAVATDAAVVLEEGIMDGIYTWKIQVPLLLNYQGASATSTTKSIAVALLVTRVPTDEAPKGIGIAQIVDGDLHA